MKIVQVVKKLNSISGQRLNFRRWLILCTALFVCNPKQASNFGGPSLKDLMDRFDMTQLCSEATHLYNNGEPSSLLDLAFTNVPHLFNYQALVSQPISASDHLPILIKTSITHQPPEPVKNVSKSWMYCKKDHVKMMNSLLFDEWSHVFQPEDDINEIWTRWKQQFFQQFFLEVESFIPCLQRTSQDRPRQPPWFSRSIGQLIRVTGIQLESGAREETGRFRDVKRCVATEDRTRVSGISLLRHNR